jgi:hypothetical protein
MRYLVKARVKSGREKRLMEAIEAGTLGKGSVAGDEYLYDMEQARVAEDGTAYNPEGALNGFRQVRRFVNPVH